MAKIRKMVGKRKLKKGIIGGYVFLTDIGSIFLSFVLAYWVRFYSGLIPLKKGATGFPPIHPYLGISVFAMIVWGIVFYLSGLYNPKKRFSFGDESYEIVKGVLLGGIVILSPIFFYRAFSFSRVTIGLSCMFSMIILNIGRGVWRIIKHQLYKKGIGLERICILGEGERIKEVVEKFGNHCVKGYKLVGQIVKENGRRGVPKVPILGNFREVRKVVERYDIDTLFIAMPLANFKEITKIILRCSGLPLDIQFVPDFYELLTSKIEHYEIEGLSLLKIKEVAFTQFDLVLKRWFDIVVSIFFILLLLPWFLVISLIVKITSKGPVFYIQKRIGVGGEEFNILKFRTMKQDAEKSTGAIFAKPGDPRVTKVGKFLRRWSLDEIPQLFNVVKGDMSLVGPRPERPEFVKKFNKEITRYFDRHHVKPGITGWAQIHGLRGDTSIKERLKYDLYYLENWSLGLDLKILFRTLNAIVLGKNAY